jgi:hypothetical protein
MKKINDKTATGKIYKALKSSRKWMSTLDLAQATTTVATSTYISDLRRSLASNASKDKIEHKQEGRIHYYRMGR